jgi:drug/metabolite transporter (DMT)-like permease
VNRASSVIYGNILSVIILAPWGLAAIPDATLHDAFSAIYLGVVQLGIAYALFTVAMARGVRSLDAGIICYVEPVLNPLWVFLVLGERPSRWALLGGAIIVIAVIIHMLLDARLKKAATATI